MVLFLRQALTGERVVFKGKTFEVDGFRLTKPPSRPVPIYVAALRPGMLSVAGEVADGVILNWLAPEDVPKSVAVVREAAERAGRDPKSIEITARIFVNLDPITPESETAVRRHVAGYLNVPVYRHFQEWLGRTEALSAMWRAWEAGDRKAALAAIPQTFLDDLFTRARCPRSGSACSATSTRGSRPPSSRSGPRSPIRRASRPSCARRCASSRPKEPRGASDDGPVDRARHHRPRPSPSSSASSR